MENCKTEKCVDSGESQVSKQLNHMEAATDELTEVIKFLANKLNPVLRDSDPKGIEGEPEDPLVPLADRIRGISKSLQHDVSFLQDIFSRLEL